MINLHTSTGKTTVSVFMSRAGFWQKESNNTQRAIRSSNDFSEKRKAQLKDNFLTKLKPLAESQ